MLRISFSIQAFSNGVPRVAEHWQGKKLVQSARQQCEDWAVKCLYGIQIGVIQSVDIEEWLDGKALDLDSKAVD